MAKVRRAPAARNRRMSILPHCPRLRPLTAAALVAAALAPAAAVGATAPAPYVPGEVVVKFKRGTSAAARAAIQRATGTRDAVATGGLARVLRIRDGASVMATVAALRRRAGVEFAAPNHLARTSFVPNDPGDGSEASGWQTLQWNFAGPAGVNAPVAWDNLRAVGRSGGKGVIVAVLDTGVAYKDRGRFERSPDLAQKRFVRGFDFVDHDPYANDHNGHGTHVASTIAEATNNGLGLTGLAYNARLMPVRVLDAAGEGDSADIADGIRYAARHGAQVINLSLEFPITVTSSDVPDIVRALRYAHKRGSVVVGASGNAAATRLAYPARHSTVISVGATTEHRCLAYFSNRGKGIDIVAPGGGADASFANDAACTPDQEPGRNIFQMTFRTSGSTSRFGLPDDYEGTSMAAPHVSAVAALVIASGVLGARPKPRQVEQRLQDTAVDLGEPGYDRHYGAGLLDAAAATAPAASAPPAAP